jgi:hypothetical protein
MVSSTNSWSTSKTQTAPCPHSDRVAIRRSAHSTASVFGRIETTHQEGWALAVLAAICAEDGEAAMGRRWLDRASRHFELLGGGDGIAFCRRTGS